MTIADFLFLETCNYMLGLYGNVDKFQFDFKKDIVQNKETLSYLEES
jgi:hypothetical protein